jgi:hypothetical protein
MATSSPNAREPIRRMPWSADDHDFESHPGVDRTGEVERAYGHPSPGREGIVRLQEMKAGHRHPALGTDDGGITARADHVNYVRVID